MSALKLLGFLAAFVFQAALLGWLIGERALLLANGTEIRLAVVPVDPRDLLRGDYVVLSYDISRLNEADLDGDAGFDRGDTIYVSLAPDGDAWRVVSLRRTRPAEGLFVKGKVVNAFDEPRDCPEQNCRALMIDYGLDRFFVPEGAGRELEALRNDERISVDVAVGRDGVAALKRLRVDGNIRFEEPLF